jgi:hypothetical protein
MTEDYRIYYRRRAEEEQAAAAVASSAEAVAAHRALAERYQRMAADSAEVAEPITARPAASN